MHLCSRSARFAGSAAVAFMILTACADTGPATAPVTGGPRPEASSPSPAPAGVTPTTNGRAPLVFAPLGSALDVEPRHQVVRSAEELDALLAVLPPDAAATARAEVAAAPDPSQDSPWLTFVTTGCAETTARLAGSSSDPRVELVEEGEQTTQCLVPEYFLVAFAA